MLIIKFPTGKSQVTWFVNNNYVMIVTFLLSFLLAKYGKKVVKKLRKSNSNSKIKIFNPTGGAFIDKCIDPNSVYEVVDPALELVIRDMFKIPRTGGPIVISTPVLILSYIVLSKPIKQLTLLGVDVIITEIQDLITKIGLGSLSAVAIALLTPTSGLLGLTGVLFGSAILLNTLLNGQELDCENIVLKLPMEQVYHTETEIKAISFVETPLEKTPKVFIKGSENTEIYVPNPKVTNFCSVEQVEKSNLRTEKNRINRNCKKDYVPLKQRTRTLSDLKKNDSTEYREKAEPYIQRYENRRKRIMNAREQIGSARDEL